MIKAFFLAAAMIFGSGAGARGANPSAIVKVGSKTFTENIILAEIAAHLIQNAGCEVIHRRELGGTRVLWNALIKGDIDLYPEYTGTIRREILYELDLSPQDKLEEALDEYGIRMSPPLGFNNTYAIGMKRSEAERLGIQSISDLADHPELRLGFSNEFMDREDGWPGMKIVYGLPQKWVRGLNHDLAYRGIESGSIDVIDLYSTDAEIEYYDFKALRDDLNYFPDYQAVLLYRADLIERNEELAGQVEKLAHQISADEMIAMNARVKLDKVPESRVASNFLQKKLKLTVNVAEEGIWRSLWLNTASHLYLVLISLSAAVVVAIPLGILAAMFKRCEKIILGVVGIIQTIPSLALLVFMIPLLGIGGLPAIAALFLYSLLPIVRNTYTGIHDISPPLRESAMALGLPTGVRLRLIEIPLASRSILAGIKTSAVINVGTATLGALIGAGGYGQPILTGIRLDDIGLILQGAVPAALLALFVQWIFDLSELLVVPKGLRLPASKEKP